MTAREVPVLIFWSEDEYGRTGGGPQPAGWNWPADIPLPQVGDCLRAPEGASPLGRGTVCILSRTWEWGRALYGTPGSTVLVLRLDCEWAS